METDYKSKSKEVSQTPCHVDLRFSVGSLLVVANELRLAIRTLLFDLWPVRRVELVPTDLTLPTLKLPFLGDFEVVSVRRPVDVVSTERTLSTLSLLGGDLGVA